MDRHPLKSIVAACLIGSILGSLQFGVSPAIPHDVAMAQSRPVIVIPEPYFEADIFCPTCGHTLHIQFYDDMPDSTVYKLLPGQKWPTLLYHLHRCTGEIRGPIKA